MYVCTSLINVVYEIINSMSYMNLSWPPEKNGPGVMADALSISLKIMVLGSWHALLDEHIHNGRIMIMPCDNRCHALIFDHSLIFIADIFVRSTLDDSLDFPMLSSTITIVM